MFDRFTETARRAVVAAQEEATGMGHGYVGTEHLLLGLLRDPGDVAARVLTGLGVRFDTVRAQLDEIVGYRTDELDADALRTVGIDLDAVRRKIEATFGPGALDTPALTSVDDRHQKRNPVWATRVPLTPRTRKVLMLAIREAAHLRVDTVGTEHVLLGLVREGHGLAARVLTEGGADLATVRTRVLAGVQRTA